MLTGLLLQVHHFYPIVSSFVLEPTHFNNYGLDYILSNIPDGIGNIDISQNSLMQFDHFMLSFTLSTPNRSSPRPPTF